MINTESKVQIEPRVGDVVKYEGCINPENEIVVTNTDDDGFMDLYEGGDGWKHLDVSDSLCTLLHRPFKVGDRTQFDGIDGWEVNPDRYQGDIPGLKIRHIKPEWRNHSSYKE